MSTSPLLSGEDTRIFDQMADELTTVGWFITESLFPPEVGRELRVEAQALYDKDIFRPAGILTGEGLGPERNTDIRTDWIFWLDRHRAGPSAARYFSIMETVRRSLNRRLFLGLWTLESHLALYMPGAFYKGHLDRTGADDSRILSCSFYLNEDWTPRDGGALRLHLDRGKIDIPPILGRAVFFWSDAIYHEVLITHRHRWSVTGWFRIRPRVTAISR